MNLSPVLFIHLPKTAGTTLIRIISNQYKWRFLWLRSDIYRAANGERIHPTDLYRKLSARRKRRVKALGGHNAIELAQELSGFKKILVARNPLEQIPSYYKHHQRHNSGSPSNLEARKHEELKSFLESKSDFYPNIQVRALLGTDIIDKEPAEVLSQIRNLVWNEIDYCGLTDRFQETLHVFTFYLKWKKSFTYRSVNQAPSQTVLSKKEQELILEKNKFDIYFYDQVSLKFSKLLEGSEKKWTPKIKVVSHKKDLLFKIRNKIQQKLICYFTGLSLFRR